MTMEQGPRKQRGAPLVARILDAALDEIARVGPYDLSIDEVAKRADVNKTTIYRRWPDPETLALAAFDHGSSTAAMPDTGTLRDDLIAYLQLMREVCRTPAMRSMARMQFSGEFAGTLGARVKARIENADCDALLLFERALARGELPAGSDLALLRDLVLGGAQHLLLFRNDPLDDHRLEQIVDLVLNGAGEAGTAAASCRAAPRRDLDDAGAGRNAAHGASLAPARGHAI